MSIMVANVQEAVAYVRQCAGDDKAPQVALILGSGLGPVAERIENPVVVPYGDVPHMMPSTVQGHKGRFVLGQLGNKQVVCMQGRIHAYEGRSADQITFPVHVMAQLGAKTLLATNASGGINVSYKVGDIVAITDHINFTGMNPLVGPKNEYASNTFIDMTSCYSKRIVQLAKEAAQEVGTELPEGVYVGDLGPSFETPAEIRAFRAWGADLVGMSTVLEAIAARYVNMEVGALSLVTNMAAGVLDQPITAEEVVETAKLRAGVMTDLICALVDKL